MLTRLKVNGFKNLIGVDVRFGPFTCIAGVNAVGKSNLFDAIRFLGALADHPLIEAAQSVRNEGGKATDVRKLFHCVGDEYDEKMSFEVEMIVPRDGFDDLGQRAVATTTFLRYAVTLAYRSDDSFHPLGKLELLEEKLTHIKRGDAKKHLLFHYKSAWLDSAVVGARRAGPFISTDGRGLNRVISLHLDRGGGDKFSTDKTTDAGSKRSRSGGGRPSTRLAATLPRTVLSATNAAESPTALLARKEMRSWRLLQLEPSSLRSSDEFTAPTSLDTDGSHLAATLYRLALSNGRNNGRPSHQAMTQVYGEIASRLSELIDDVYELNIDRDERRQLLTLLVTGRDSTSHPASALSDGTLRFLALAVLERDSEAQGVICLEEPENGIHPERIPAMLRLLQDIATDVNEAVSADNPLRQVMINTHSSAVVLQVPNDSLLIAELKETVQQEQRFKRVSFGPRPKTWRENAPDKVMPAPNGKLVVYLNPVLPNGTEGTRVVDSPDLQGLLFPLKDDHE